MDPNIQRTDPGSTSWHLDKRLSIGTLVSLGAMFLALSGGWYSVKADVQSLKNEPKVEIEQVARIEERQKQFAKDIDAIKQDTKRLPAIEEALKNLAEKIDREREERQNGR